MKKDTTNFEIFYNALSVGWHLAKIMSLDKDMVSETPEYEKFIKWLGRHDISEKTNSKKK